MEKSSSASIKIRSWSTGFANFGKSPFFDNREIRERILAININKPSINFKILWFCSLLFWGQTNFGIFAKPRGEIWRIDTSGSNRTIIARERIGIVSGITIDHRRSHLYWADASLELIERSDLDGNDRQTFLQHRVSYNFVNSLQGRNNSIFIYICVFDFVLEVRQPVGINIYEDSVYWLVGTLGVLKKCRIYGDRACETIRLGPSNVNQLFVISQTSRQPNGKFFLSFRAKYSLRWWKNWLSIRKLHMRVFNCFFSNSSLESSSMVAIFWLWKPSERRTRVLGFFFLWKLIESVHSGVLATSILSLIRIHDIP